MAQLTVVTGQPAVGKTTWAQHFASEQRACLIDIDTVFEPVIQAGLALAGMPEDDRDSAAYKQAFRQPVYTAMYASAAANLPHVPVVLCAPFTRELAQAGWAEQLHKQFGCSVEIVWLTASMATIKQRMEKRGNPRDRAKLAQWDNYQQYFSVTPPLCKHTHIAT